MARLRRRFAYDMSSRSNTWLSLLSRLRDIAASFKLLPLVYVTSFSWTAANLLQSQISHHA
jgi:hypothetical protein